MSGISAQAVLVDLNISVWTGRVRDKQASDEVVASNQAKSKQAARVIKSLFADEPKLAAIVNLSQIIRNWHHANTLPWSDTGTRLLPMENFLTYKRELSEWEDQFNTAVGVFLQDYPVLISAAAFRLGNLFSRSEYPSQGALARKFNIGASFHPVPESGDFRIKVQDEELQELRDQYEAQATSRLETAMGDIWQRLHGVLTRMSTQFGFDEGRKKRIHQSMFDSARGLVNLMSALNVTKDPELERARLDLAQALETMNAEDIRKYEAARVQAKRAADALLTQYGDKFKGEEDGSEADNQVERAADGDNVLGDHRGEGVPAENAPPTTPDFSLLDF